MGLKTGQVRTAFNFYFSVIFKKNIFSAYIENMLNSEKVLKQSISRLKMEAHKNLIISFYPRQILVKGHGNETDFLKFFAEIGSS